MKTQPFVQDVRQIELEVCDVCHAAVGEPCSDLRSGRPKKIPHWIHVSATAVERKRPVKRGGSESRFKR